MEGGTDLEKDFPSFKGITYFDSTVTTLRRILKKWVSNGKAVGPERKTLIERENIVNWRCAYCSK